MSQAIITWEGTSSALVTGQLPVEAKEAVSLFNIPRSQVDRSKRPQCHTKQRTRSQNSSQPQAPPPEVLHGSLGSSSAQAPSPSHLQGTHCYLCCSPQQKSALCKHCPSPGEQGRGMQGSASSLPLANTKISSQEPRERAGVSACSGSNTRGQSSNIRVQMMTGKKGRNKKRTI